ncbi:hypothetical protein TURU_005506 [Turdus rufiventris]|nr:hypothetical protein TURU_005506 [Turdus rufiventris]
MILLWTLSNKFHIPVICCPELPPGLESCYLPAEKGLIDTAAAAADLLSRRAEHQAIAANFLPGLNSKVIRVSGFSASWDFDYKSKEAKFFFQFVGFKRYGQSKRLNFSVCLVYPVGRKNAAICAFLIQFLESSFLREQGENRYLQRDFVFGAVIPKVMLKKGFAHRNSI